jgi:hypothetical protein
MFIAAVSRSYRGTDEVARGLNNSLTADGHGSVRDNGSRAILGRTRGGVCGISACGGRVSGGAGTPKGAELEEMTFVIRSCPRRDEFVPSS